MFCSFPYRFGRNRLLPGDALGCVFLSQLRRTLHLSRNIFKEHVFWVDFPWSEASQDTDAQLPFIPMVMLWKGLMQTFSVSS